MSQTDWIIIIFVILIFAPFYVFFLARVQMLGWLSAVKQLIKHERNDDETKQIQR